MNYLKLLEEIDGWVNTDFMAEMEMKTANGEKYTQSEAKQMAKILVEVFFISHTINCKSCAKKYEKKNHRNSRENSY